MHPVALCREVKATALARVQPNQYAQTACKGSEGDLLRQLSWVFVHA